MNERTPVAASRSVESRDLARLRLVFHTREWADLVHDVYGFDTLRVETPGGILPLFHTRSPLLGSKLVSAVFNGYAGPLYRDVEACDQLVRRAVAIANARDVDYLELRCLDALPDPVIERHRLVQRTHYRATVLRLGAYADVAVRYDRKFRKNLRSARRRLAAAGVRVERTVAGRDLRAFHDLLVRRYRDRHAMIAQPFALFEAIRSRFLLRNAGDLLVARDRSGAILGGLLFLHHAGAVTGAWGAVDAVDPRWCLDAVMKDDSIRHYCDAGASLYDLGLSSPKQAGLLFAKSRFGGCTFEAPFYYHLVRAHRPPEIDFADAYPWLRRAFRHVPVAIVKRLSPIVVRRLT